MIPHQLQLKNFLSYGPELQTIDFTNYHLICLTGKNGHGKSALLDAITWAIWGQARKSSGNSKADAGILHLGQNHMMVILEFEVNGQNYRVRREYLQTKSKPFASLDFGIKQADGKLIALTDKTIKDTQEKIDTTIGITYESFVNSTFLRQGQSNEFSKKSPKERKEILAQILQLQKFDEQKKIAISYAKKLNQESVAKCSIQTRIEQELIDLASVKELQLILNENIQTVSSQKKQNDETKAILVEKKQTLLQNIKELELLEIQHSNLKKDLNLTKQEIETIAKKWHETQLAIHSKTDIKSLELESNNLQKSLQVFQESFHKKLQLKEQYLATKEKLSLATSLLEKEFEKKQQELNLLSTKQEEQLKQAVRQEQSETIVLQSLMQELQKSQADILSQQKDLQQIQDQIETGKLIEELFEKNKILYQSLCSQGTYLKQHATKLDQDIEKQSTQECPTCPLCDQNLSNEHKKALNQKLLLESSQAQKSVQEIKEQASLIKLELSTQNEQLKSLKTKQEIMITLSAKVVEHAKQHEKLILQHTLQEKTVTERSKEKKGLQDILSSTMLILEQLKKNHLNAMGSHDFQLLHKQLQEIEFEGKKLSYDPIEHKNIEQKYASLRKTLESTVSDSEIIKHQSDKKAQLFELFNRAQSITDQINLIQEKLEALQQINALSKELCEQELLVEKELSLINSKYQILLLEKGSLEQKEKKQISLNHELEHLIKHIKSVQQELFDYQEIAKALGKDGIQALLIEQAIPEIEHETNLVLARLTNNQTQIFIESLRDLKKGGSRETLDIKISDQFGLRDYELFSGGEAFRIDFALRIGISKLLARRAGTTLQTIFIDEGFGSQDEEGLQLIMDNLYKIQDDFAKIIIVSHLQEMKEQFPVQFVVDKKRSGSVVSVVHQG
ncbi:MAG: SMC family ATPase [Candidatus Dependentiae bacterium]|nr:SMC family ATPase [Candidatus Dependentiae bacterium]